MLLHPLAVYSQNNTINSNPKEAALQVNKTSSKITIDGRADEASWQNAKAHSFENFYKFEKPSDKQNSRFKMLWDEEHIYFFFECDDQFITAREQNQDGEPYFDDCAEIFLIPKDAKINMHLRYEVNLYKSSNDFVFINDIYDNENFVVKSFNPDFDVEVTVNGSINDNSDIDKGWTMEFAIPISNFHINEPTTPIQEGAKWAFLALREERNDPMSNRRSTSTLFTLKPENQNVHYPKSFINRISNQDRVT